MANIQKQHAEKKGRKRFKKLFSQIRGQMEFYFSDANLHKDRFLKQQLQQSSDGYVDLEMFLRFNKIRALVDNTELLAKALSKSDILELNEDKTRVRRTKPLGEATNVDERTIYVECLPAGINHDWVRNSFASCGKVVYVSLPKYRTTRNIKGFAFVEFDTVEAAQTACLAMNNPPSSVADMQPGKFPKSKQLKSVERQMEFCQKRGRKRRASESMAESSEEVSAAKIRRTFSEGEKPSFSKRQQHVKPHITEPATLSSDSTVRTDDQSEPTAKSEGKRVTDGEQAPSRKDRKRKRSSIQSSSEQESEVVVTSAKTAIADDDDAANTEVICQGAVNQVDSVTKLSQGNKHGAEDVKQTAKKQKRANKLKKQKKCENKEKSEPPRLRVISKSEWLQLRTEYLSLQKTNVAQLKSSLKALKQEMTDKTAEVENGSNSKVLNVRGNDVEPKQTETSSLVFTPNVIIHICSDSPLSRNDLKTRLSPLGTIAYFDVQDGHRSGHIRCSDASSAAQIIDAQIPGCSLQLLTGEPELCYWQQATADREKKYSCKKSRTAKRGRDKIMKKAEKVDANQRQHIVFDD